MPDAENTTPDHIVENTTCPACGARKGQRCTTMIEGIDMGWTHDSRVYADLGVRVIPPGGKP